MVVTVSRLERVRGCGGFSAPFPSRTSTRSRGRSTRVACRAVVRRFFHVKRTRCITTSAPTPIFRSTRTARRSPATPRSSSSTRSAGSISCSSRRTSAARKDSRSTTSGFLRRADQQSWNTWVGFFDRHERKYYQRFQWNNNWWQYWTTAGLPLEAAYNTNTHITFKNNWGLNAGGTLGQLGTTYDDRAARGGPAIRQDPYLAPWLFISGNDRRSLVPSMSVNYFRGSAGRNWSWNLSPEIDYKALARFSSAFSLNWSHNVSDNQWYGNFRDQSAMLHYTFAHLDQTTTSATVRLNYTFTPDVSLQGYVQPFVSKGTYSNVRQLSATPRAPAYDDRYTTYNNGHENWIRSCPGVE